VRAVYEELVARAGTGYTTTLKLLQIMADKGLVARDESRRAHVYRAVVGEEPTQRRLVRDLPGQAFAGSAAKLGARALSERLASEEEMVEIRRLVEGCHHRLPGPWRSSARAAW
jgi:BlaI family transcriptional regulator, penicillinase repressor